MIALDGTRRGIPYHYDVFKVAAMPTFYFVCCVVDGGHSHDLSEADTVSTLKVVFSVLHTSYHTRVALGPCVKVAINVS